MIRLKAGDIDNDLESINLEGLAKGIYVFDFVGENASLKEKVLVR